ncbi:MAG TPA: hypothetical protein VGP16_19815 [Asanoa sp.]|nr:hypothetical protein [Asanoa sp.]
MHLGLFNINMGKQCSPQQMTAAAQAAEAAGFETEVPYTVVIVSAAADPRIRFVGRLADGHEVPAIGDPMVASFVPNGDVTLVNWLPRGGHA